MELIKKNLLANAVTYAYVPVVTLACTPLYIHAMGMEAFGLVGVFTLLFTFLSPLGMGVHMALNRQLAHLSVQEKPARDMRDLLRTLEAACWLTAAALGIVVVAVAPVISNYWVKAEHLSAATINRAVFLMGITLVLQWPHALYTAGLVGLQRQVPLSVINMAMLTLRFVGVLPVLWYVSPTIEAFFIWNAGASAVQTAALYLALWLSLPKAEGRAAFRWSSFKTVWRFAGGVTGLSVAGVVLSQQDKVVLSKVLTLEMFGYYTLASMAALGLYTVVGPVFNALSPRLVQLASLDAKEELRQLYHLGCQLTAAPLLGMGVMGVMFSREILMVWTGDPVTVENTCLAMSLLFVGTALNGLAAIPYAVQLAYGRTRFALYVNLIAAVALAPLLILLAMSYGAVGAAAAWTIVNIGCLVAFVQLTHSRFLKGEQWRWYVHDVAMPLVAGVVACAVARFLIPGDLSRLALLLCLALAGMGTLAATTLASGHVREAILAHVFRKGAAARANDVTTQP